MVFWVFDINFDTWDDCTYKSPSLGDILCANFLSHCCHLSFLQGSGTVVAEEVFLFGDGREALKVPVASWSSTHDLIILNEPGIGPSDFQGHVVNVVTILVRESFSTHPHTPVYNRDQCTAVWHNVGILHLLGILFLQQRGKKAHYSLLLQ